jgi:hypothetical protein
MRDDPCLVEQADAVACGGCRCGSYHRYSPQKGGFFEARSFASNLNALGRDRKRFEEDQTPLRPMQKRFLCAHLA